MTCGSARNHACPRKSGENARSEWSEWDERYRRVRALHGESSTGLAFSDEGRSKGARAASEFQVQHPRSRCRSINSVKERGSHGALRSQLSTSPPTASSPKAAKALTRIWSEQAQIFARDFIVCLILTFSFCLHSSPFPFAPRRKILNPNASPAASNH